MKELTIKEDLECLPTKTSLLFSEDLTSPQTASSSSYQLASGNKATKPLQNIVLSFTGKVL